VLLALAIEPRCYATSVLMKTQSACRRCGNSARALGASTPILARRRRIVIVGVDEGDGASPPRLLAMAAGCGNRL